METIVASKKRVFVMIILILVILFSFNALAKITKDANGNTIVTGKYYDTKYKVGELEKLGFTEVNPAYLKDGKTLSGPLLIKYYENIDGKPFKTELLLSGEIKISGTKIQARKFNGKSVFMSYRTSKNKITIKSDIIEIEIVKSNTASVIEKRRRKKVKSLELEIVSKNRAAVLRQLQGILVCKSCTFTIESAKLTSAQIKGKAKMMKFATYEKLKDPSLQKTITKVYAYQPKFWEIMGITDIRQIRFVNFKAYSQDTLQGIKTDNLAFGFYVNPKSATSMIGPIKLQSSGTGKIENFLLAPIKIRENNQDTFKPMYMIKSYKDRFLEILDIPDETLMYLELASGSKKEIPVYDGGSRTTNSKLFTLKRNMILFSRGIYKRCPIEHPGVKTNYNLPCIIFDKANKKILITMDSGEFTAKTPFFKNRFLYTILQIMASPKYTVLNIGKIPDNYGKIELITQLISIPFTFSRVGPKASTGIKYPAYQTNFIAYADPNKIGQHYRIKCQWNPLKCERGQVVRMKTPSF